MEHLVRGDGKLPPRNVRHERPAARRDKDMLRRELGPRGQTDPVRIHDHRALVVDGDACVLQRVAVSAFQAVQLGLQPGAEVGPVKAAHSDIPAIFPRLGDGFGIGRREDHQLFRHAAPDDAGAAHPAFLGQTDLGTIFARSDPRRAHPARATTDDEEIVVESHVKPLRRCCATELFCHATVRKSPSRAFA